MGKKTSPCARIIMCACNNKLLIVAKSQTLNSKTKEKDHGVFTEGKEQKACF